MMFVFTEALASTINKFILDALKLHVNFSLEKVKRSDTSEANKWKEKWMFMFVYQQECKHVYFILHCD